VNVHLLRLLLVPVMLHHVIIGSWQHDHAFVIIACENVVGEN